MCVVGLWCRNCSAYVGVCHGGTVSNALEKSRMVISNCFFLSNDCSISCIVTANWVSHEEPDLKPWFNDVSMLCFSRWFIIFLHIICSMSLHGTDVSEMCSFLPSVYLLFCRCWIYSHLASLLGGLQCRWNSGIWWLVMVLVVLHIVLVSCLGCCLDRLMFLSSFSTPSVFIFIDGIVDFRSMWVSGMLSTLPLVNTEENCYINICAFSLLWLTSFPFSFRGATMILSCLLDFTYFQNGLLLLFFIPSVMALFM